MPKLIIDGLEIEAPKGMRVIEAAERLGIVIPRFCYHPALGPVEACRVCAVKFDGPLKGIHMSCKVEVRDGMEVSTTDAETVDFRKHVIEWLMMNHPHDCPVCDEGGQCLLQDMTVSCGHGLRRYPGKKLTYRDQYLGPFVRHEMNRCIHCYRCWRFYQGFAGYRDLGVMQIAERTYFGRFNEGRLESPFSGNLNDICPTGVYTDKPSRYFGRRWDFQRSPSLCIHCSLGCNTVANARYREVVRQEARVNRAVNGYFLCDRGRYAFPYASYEQRPRTARVRDREAPLQESLDSAAEALARIRQTSGGGSIAALSSARSCIENQGMLKYLCRSLGWAEPRYFENPALAARAHEAVSRLDGRIAVSMAEIEKSDFILVLGADPVNEAPMLALAMRQAFRDGAGVDPMMPLPQSPVFIEGIPIVVFDPRPVFLPFQFTHVPLSAQRIDAAAGALVKRSLDSSIEGISAEARKFHASLPPEYPFEGPVLNLFPEIEGKLRASRNPVVICGTDIVRDSTVSLAADIARLFRQAKKEAGLFYILPGANSFGPELLSPAGGSLSEIVSAIEEEAVKALIVVESDPFWLYPNQERLAAALAKLEFLLVLDYVSSPTVSQAHVFFPTTPLFESGSSFVNQEGRLQFAAPVYDGGIPIFQTGGGGHPPRRFGRDIPGHEPQPAWQLLARLGNTLQGEAQLGAAGFPEDIDGLWQMLALQTPALSGIAGPDYALRRFPEGIRLIPEARDFPFSLSPSSASESGADMEVLLVDWTFGTEELAGYSPFIREVENDPCALMHPDDASRLGLKTKDRVVILLDGGPLETELRLAENMAAGSIVIPRHRQLFWQKIKRVPVKIQRKDIKKV